MLNENLKVGKFNLGFVKYNKKDKTVFPQNSRFFKINLR